MRETTYAHKVLVEISQGKIPPRLPRRRWEDNIKMGIKKIWEPG
jgi:hypothetical protein